MRRPPVPASTRLRKYPRPVDRAAARKPNCHHGLRGLETLEDRLLLAVQAVDLGPLRFFGDFFQDPKSPSSYTASGPSEIQLGLVPAAGEAFTPLVDIDAKTGGSVAFTTGTDEPEFTVANVVLESAVAGAMDVPLWQTAAAFRFDAKALAGNGVNLTSGAQPVTVGDGTFTLNNIRFANPGDAGTADSQVKLQGSLIQPPLVGLDLAVEEANFLILDGAGETLTGVSPSVSGSLSVGGLGFSVRDLVVEYSGGEFVLTGITSFKVGPDSVTANFMSPGLVIGGGAIRNFNLALTSSLDVGGLSFTTNNLKVSYTDATRTYAVTGGAAVAVAGQSLAVTFGGGGTNGLVIADGELTSLDVAVVSTFKLLGLEVRAGTQADPLTFTYSKAADEYTLSGALSVPELFGATVSLGSSPSRPGITVKDGDFELDRVSLELSDVPLGAFTITELLVAYTSDSFAVTLDLWFPEGWKVGGTVGFLDGELNTIGFSFSTTDPGEGIEIGDTGVAITGLSGEVQNIERPADLIVSGSITAVWGVGQLITVSGGFLVDKDELVLDGDVSFLGGYGQGDARMVLDWGAQDYSIFVEVSWYDDTFQFDAVIDLSDGGEDLYVKAQADVKVPGGIPFIGGKTLGDIDFVLEYHAGDLANSFVAAWIDVHILFISFDAGIKVDFNGDLSFLSNEQVGKIDSPPPNPQPQSWVYTVPFTVPENTTQANLDVRWPEAAGNQSVAVILPDGGATYSQAQFSAANGIGLLPQFSTAQSYGIGLVGSSADPYAPLPAGTYNLQLTSSYQFASAPTVQPSYSYARPTIGVGALPGQTGSPVTVPLAGKAIASGDLSVRATLFVDDDPSGYDGTPLPDARNLGVTRDAQGNWTLQAVWDPSGLLPINYYLYAAINDGLNGPVYSAYSTPVAYQPPLSGTVTNPKYEAPQSGFTVYIDVDQNGQFDPSSEPSTTTDSSGFYSFATSEIPTVFPFYVGLVVPSGYRLHAGFTNPQLINSGDFTPYSVPFEVDEFAAIHGTVSATPASGATPLSGWTVFLDADGDGRLDAGEVATITDSSGAYAFHSLPVNTTQVVRLQVRAGYYRTSPAGSGSISVAVGPDPFGVYSKNDFGALANGTVSGTVTGYELTNGVLDPDTSPLQGWTVQLNPPVYINAGGTAAGPFAADEDFSGGQSPYPYAGAIDVSRVADPAPQAVYQTNRFGKSVSYAVTGLTPDAAYDVRMDFAETFWTQAGQRVFNVAINGAPVLGNFDIIASAGGPLRGTAQLFRALADASGTIALQFTAVTDNAQINGIRLTPVAYSLALNAGGAAAGSYAADEDFSGGSDAPPYAGAIDTSRVADPAPQAVYQANRFDASGTGFSYAFPGLIPNAAYTVRLDFAETFWSAPGQRVFDVDINGQPALSGFDILANADNRRFAAIARHFTALADAAGTITVRFTSIVNFAQVNGIAIAAGVRSTTTDAQGRYTFEGLRAGTYTVAQVVPTGWRQVSPFASDLQLVSPAGADVLTVQGAGFGSFPPALADFNDDGKLDIAALSQAAGGVAVYLDGAFNAQDFVTFPAPAPYGIVGADLLGTGRQDIAAVDFYGEVDAIRNDGRDGLTQYLPGVYELGPVNIFAGITTYGVAKGRFVPGDGGDQIAYFYSTRDQRGITSLNLAVRYYSQGDGASAVLYISLNDWALGPTSMAVGDVNNDGYDDALLGFAARGPILAYGNASNQYTPIAVLPAGGRVAMADIDGDGLLDLGVFAASDGTFRYAIQDQAGNFRAYASGVGTAGQAIDSALLVDVNGDFRPDLVWTANGALSVALNTRQAGNWFAPSAVSQVAIPDADGGGVFVAAGDMDDDGLADLVLVEPAAGVVAIVRNRSVTSARPIATTVDGSASTANDFVDGQVGQVGGRVFDDLDRDGVESPSEPGRTGVTVYVDLDGDGVLDRDEPRATTGSLGLYAFDGLPAGTHRIRLVPEPGRRLTTPGAGYRDVVAGGGLPPAEGVHFGSTEGLDPVWAIPAGSSGDWTLVRNGDRLEVRDALLGVVHSERLAALDSVTIAGRAGAADRLTIDLASGGFFATPGGVGFLGGDGDGDRLRFLLGLGNDQLSLDGAAGAFGGTATVDAGLSVRWLGAESLEIDAGRGGDTALVNALDAPLTFRGRDGDDRLILSQDAASVRAPVIADGGAGRDLLVGGPLGDILAGGPGDDTVRGGAGDDLVTWADGDGSDLIDGEAGSNTVRVVGSDREADAVIIAPNGARVLVRIANGRSATLDLGSIGLIDVHAGGGADSFDVTPLPQTRVALDGGESGGDRLIVRTGSAARPAFRYDGPGSGSWSFADALPVTFANIESFNAPPAVGHVLGLYGTVLGHEPRVDELNFWLKVIDAGATPADLARGFWESPEHRGLQVDGYYATYLGRAADPGGRAYWVSALLAGASEADVQRRFLASPEYRATHPRPGQFVAGVYREVLGRAPTKAERSAAIRAARGGAGRAKLAGRILKSRGAAVRLVTGYYQQLLGRPAASSEIRPRVGQLASGRITPSLMAERFLGSEEFLSRFQ